MIIFVYDQTLIIRYSHSSQTHINNRRPAWINPKAFLPTQFQNLFEMGICTETSSPIPTGSNSVSDDRDYPKLSSRIPAESPSSEDQFDDATNGTASNDDSSSDEVPRLSTEISLTRMNEESDDEDNEPPVKVISNPRPNPLTRRATHSGECITNIY